MSVNGKNAGESVCPLLQFVERRASADKNVLDPSVAHRFVECHRRGSGDVFSVRVGSVVNVYCELELADGSVQKIMTDGSWKVADIATGNSDSCFVQRFFLDECWSRSHTHPSSFVRIFQREEARGWRGRKNSSWRFF